MNVLADTAPAARRTSPLSLFEFWPGWLFYTPVVLFWILMGVRYRGFSLPTAANPKVETGGLCGERKSTILDQAGAVARDWIAPYVVIVTGVDDRRGARAAISRAGLSLPLVVKPNIGCNGTGVRLVESDAALDAALASFPRDVELMLQELIPYEAEAGIFYVREPGASSGSITSITLKHAPVVVGDGRATLRELILADERAHRLPEIYFPRLASRLDEVLPAGERLRLVFAGNHCKGSIFTDGRHDITRILAARVDEIMQAIPDFHFGRLDVRFRDEPSLRMGQDFRIIEINGVGSEATHIWDATTSLRAAYLEQFRHYRTAFRIGARMRARGEKPTPLFELLRYWRLQRRLMRSYPLND